MKRRYSPSELTLASVALMLGARRVGGELSPAEQRLAADASGSNTVPPRAGEVRRCRSLIRAGLDPLGDALCHGRTALERRATGAFYTHPTIVEGMLRWVAAQNPDDVIDCGCGSGRFAVQAARLPAVNSVTAIDLDPLACLITRANLAVHGATHVRVLNADFMSVTLPHAAGKRAFVGNPPYVRHHGLSLAQKRHGQDIARSLGVRLSGLAGLHAHFLFAAAALADPGDVLCFITSAEWLDVNYGRGMRDLVMDGLRAEEIHLLDASVPAFGDAASTAVILCARAGGDAEGVHVSNATTVSRLIRLDAGGRVVPRTALQAAKSWGKIIRGRYADSSPGDAIPLGSVARVHRGAVTGANGFFVMSRERADELGLSRCVRPLLTSAEEVLSSGGIVRDTPARKVLLCPPETLGARDRAALERYIRSGEDRGLHERYVPSHRATWWRPQVLEAPPIVATYMARQAPAFALNPDGLLILNVLHGLYPLAPLADDQLRALAEMLTGMRESYRGHGRTYHGGLEKFEPREMERLVIPSDTPHRLSMLCDA